jgi:hypothetical protein
LNGNKYKVEEGIKNESKNVLNQLNFILYILVKGLNIQLFSL